jgi:hypothetical protein
MHRGSDVRSGVDLPGKGVVLRQEAADYARAMTKPFVCRHEAEAHDGCFEFDSEGAEERATWARGPPKQPEGDLEVARSEPGFARAEVADPEHAVQVRVVGPPCKQRCETGGCPYRAVGSEILEGLSIGRSPALARERIKRAVHHVKVFLAGHHGSGRETPGKKIPHYRPVAPLA